MNTFLKRAVWFFMIIPPVYLAIVWNTLPAKIAMHFDLKGNPDRYGDKQELLVLVSILTIANILIYLLLTNIYRIDPKKYALENKERFHKIALSVSIFLSAVLLFVIYSSDHTNLKFGVSFILAGTGLLFALMGNYMHNIKPNYFAGFRLPWTLENEENWRKTHLLAGKLWFAGGLLIAVLCLLLPPVASIASFFAIMVTIVLIPAFYSYNIYKKQKAVHSNR